MSSGTAAPAQTDPLTSLLVETLKAANKDNLGQLASTYATQGASMEATKLAYDALDAAAFDIGVRVETRFRRPPRPPVLLHPGEDLSELSNLRALVAWLGQVEESLRAEAAPPQGDALDSLAALGATKAFVAPAAAAIAGPLASAAISLLGLFTRRSTSESHTAVAIGEADLLAAVQKELERRTFDTRRLATLLPRAAMEEEARLLPRLRRLAEAAGAARTRLGEIEAALAPAPPAAGGAPPPAPPEAPRLRGAKLRIEAALRVVDAIWAAMPGLLPRLLLADAAEAHLGGGGVILALRIIAASATTVTTNRAIGSPGTAHAGGVLIAATLFDRDGTVLFSDRIAETRPKAPRSD